MSYVVRDSRFILPAEDRPRPVVRYARPSLAKQFERRLVGVWKLMTKNGRKQPRNSFIARDFVTITNRRRSVYYQHLTR